MEPKNVFPVNDVDPNRLGGWIVDLSPAGIVNPDCYHRFKSRKTAERFAKLVADGLTPAQAIGELQRHPSGTAPDTSLYLGSERRAWLQQQGGIQPTIQRLIDQAMQEQPDHAT